MLFRLQGKAVRRKLIFIGIKQTEEAVFDKFVGMIGDFDELFLVLPELDDFRLQGNGLLIHDALFIISLNEYSEIAALELLIININVITNYW